MMVPVWLVALAFLLTGGSALLIEQALERLLSTVVGASADASAIVLSQYFLGLSIGAALFRVWSRRVKDGVRLYALLEVVIGVWALFLGLAFPVLQALSALVVQAGGESELLTFILRVLIGAAWILPPTIAMGGSFPAIVSWIVRARPDGASLLGRFYALNVAGAFLGSLSAAYVLFPTLGVRGALLATAVVEIVVAVAVWFSARAAPSAVTADALDEENERVIDVLRAPELRGWLLLGALSGFSVFSFEVLWIHLAGVTLGMSAYTFATVISVVLAGLSIGGFLASRLPTRGGDPRPALALAIGVCALAAAYPFWDEVPLAFLGQPWADTFAEGELLRLRNMLWVVALPSVALGFVYPVLLARSVAPWSRAAAVAALGLVNGLGSLLGALVTGFVLLGSIGSEEAYRLHTFVLVIVVLAIALPKAQRDPIAVALSLVAAAGLTLAPLWDRLALTSGTNVYFRLAFVSPQSELVYWHEDNTGGITTIVKADGVHTLLTNGKFQGNDAGEVVAQTGFALMPCLMTSGRERALAIGLGTGQSAGILHRFGFAHVDIAEISEGIVEAAHVLGGLNGGVLEQPNVRVILEDGRNFLLRTDTDYDVISMEISSIWFAGSSSLYSQEFYELARAHLRDGGVLQQWIQLHHISLENLESVLATVGEVFEHVNLWVVGGQGIILASDAPLGLGDGARLETPALKGVWPLISAAGEALPAGPLLESAEVKGPLRARARRLNTDANRFLEYATPRHNLDGKLTVESSARGLLEFLSDKEREARLLRALHGPSFLAATLTESVQPATVPPLDDGTVP
jgi:spermidine synthase